MDWRAATTLPQDIDAMPIAPDACSSPRSTTCRRASKARSIGWSTCLQPHVGSRLAMLVVPNHWGDAPIVPGSPFATRLRAWADAGIEMFLHGFFHRDDARHAEARTSVARRAS